MPTFKRNKKLIAEHQLNKDSSTYTSNLFELATSIDMHQNQIRVNKAKRNSTNFTLPKLVQNVTKT